MSKMSSQHFTLQHLFLIFIIFGFLLPDGVHSAPLQQFNELLSSPTDLLREDYKIKEGYEILADLFHTSNNNDKKPTARNGDELVESKSTENSDGDRKNSKIPSMTADGEITESETEKISEEGEVSSEPSTIVLPDVMVHDQDSGISHVDENLKEEDSKKTVEVVAADVAAVPDVKPNNQEEPALIQSSIKFQRPTTYYQQQELKPEHKITWALTTDRPMGRLNELAFRLAAVKLSALAAKLSIVTDILLRQ